MTKHLVRFQSVADGGVWVDVEDPEDAWNEAYNHLPTLCAQCTGYRMNFFLELGDDPELYAVESEDGEELLTDSTFIDQLRDQVQELSKKLAAVTTERDELRNELVGRSTEETGTDW